jgi:non-ribosomal peptide synthetase component F
MQLQSWLCLRPGELLSCSLESPLACATCKQLLRCRCAFMPLDTNSPCSHVAQMLQQAQPSILIWADRDTEGGAGPLSVSALPHCCMVHQITVEQGLHQAAGGTSLPGVHVSVSACTKPIANGLCELIADWQIACEGLPELPFCYVMYTSGSTGKPTGVCGTEAGG